MNLGMILNAPYPADIRIKKETDALIKAGFKIHLLCIKSDEPTDEEVVEGIHVKRIHAGKNNFQLALRDVAMSLTFKHPEFMKAMPAWIKENNISAIHVHDLPLAGTALAIRKKHLIKVVVDLHENYPEALRTWFEWKTGWLVKLKNKLFMNPDRWFKHEHTAVVQADKVIAVVEEMKLRLLEDHKIDPGKITIVSNTEDKAFIQQTEDPAIYKDYTGKFIITYSGNIGPHRGVDTVIEAMKYIKDLPHVIFVVVGSGSEAVMRMLKTLAHQHQVENHVFFLGRQPFKKFYSYMKFTDVNIIPHKSNRHTDNTIPHKLFQAMMTGKPVIVSSSDPLRRVITATQGGLYFEAGNANDLASVIRKLVGDKSLQDKLGQNGLHATLQGEWNWEHEQKKLIDLYSSLS